MAVLKAGAMAVLGFNLWHFVVDRISRAESGNGFHLRIGAWANVLVVCLPFTYFGWSLVQWRGHVAFGQAVYYLNRDPLRAFTYHLKAYEIHPWDWHIRYQLFLTFANLVDKRTVRTSYPVVNKLYGISVTASPYSELLKITRDSFRLEVKE